VLASVSTRLRFAAQYHFPTSFSRPQGRVKAMLDLVEIEPANVYSLIL